MAHLLYYEEHKVQKGWFDKASHITYIFISLALLFLLGCHQSKEPQKDHESQEPVVDYEAGNYHGIGETFSFHPEFEPEIEAEITVDDIWVEDATSHEEIFQQEDVEMVEESTVTFITFTARNGNDDALSYLYFLPSYNSSNVITEDINFNYPDNNVYPVTEPHSYEKIDRGTTQQITAAIPTTKYEEYGGVFFGNPASRTPEVSSKLHHLNEKIKWICMTLVKKYMY